MQRAVPAALDGRRSNGHGCTTRRASQISSLIAPTPTGSILGGGGRDDTVMGYDCAARVFSDRLAIPTPKACSRSLARSLLAAFPSPFVASWGMQCSAGAATSHRIVSHPSQAPTSPVRCTTEENPGHMSCKSTCRADGDGVARPHS